MGDWYTRYDSPHNAGKAKPVVDLSKPTVAFKYEDMRNWHGVMPQGLMGFQNSINHYLPGEEPVPWTQTYSSWECCRIAWLTVNILYHAYWGNLKHTGSINFANPRTRWAHAISYWAGCLRLNLATAIGAGGYFYGYEFMYTYVPGLKIDDPSIDGWKRPWRENQSTTAARFLAGLFPLAGYLLWKGSMKGLLTMFWVMSTANMYFELCRYGLVGGMFLTYQNYMDNMREQSLGTMTPDLEQRVDTLSGKMKNAHSRKYVELMGDSSIQKDHCGWDYSPANPQGIAIPNPYYTWNRSLQRYRSDPILYHTQDWEMPQVWNYRMNSGVGAGYE